MKDMFSYDKARMLIQNLLIMKIILLLGHIPQKKDDYKKKLRALAATYVTFSPDGTELLVNLGGEQIYLFDVNQKRRMQKFDTTMVLSANGFVKGRSHRN